MTELTPDLLRGRLQAAERRRADALAAYETANAEIAWLRDGLRLFGTTEEADPESAVARVGEGEVTELFPDADFFSSTGAEPTLRQAIVLVMRDNAGTQWRVNDLVAALARRGWLPARDDATKRVSDMAGIMVQDRQLARIARGTYTLSPGLRANLDVAHLRRAGRE